MEMVNFEFCNVVVYNKKKVPSNINSILSYIDILYNFSQIYIFNHGIKFCIKFDTI
jgi:hypothetical protein